MTSGLSECPVYTTFPPQALLWGLAEVGVVYPQMPWSRPDWTLLRSTLMSYKDTFAWDSAWNAFILLRNNPITQTFLVLGWRWSGTKECLLNKCLTLKTNLRVGGLVLTRLFLQPERNSLSEQPPSLLQTLHGASPCLVLCIAKVEVCFWAK